ncbi:hypothetical protein Tco_1257220, partial [Tanacetum coccineum]
TNNNAGLGCMNLQEKRGRDSSTPCAMAEGPIQQKSNFEAIFKAFRKGKFPKLGCIGRSIVLAEYDGPKMVTDYAMIAIIIELLEAIKKLALYLSYIMDVATPTNDSLSVYDLLLHVMKGNTRSTLSRQEIRILGQIEDRIEEIFAAVFENYKALTSLESHKTAADQKVSKEGITSGHCSSDYVGVVQPAKNGTSGTTMDQKSDVIVFPHVLQAQANE